ncbi:cutinase [Pyrenophora seminiperda CCB06]|uniref:cutinase n=1 Tax=Pyrenophora seminiperda CCB06 TaxID=1302712 RepID=A0A3M7MA94_9PLEO|nr:cutinase [Pyrenophora seminiperda CCB06]
MFQTQRGRGIRYGAILVCALGIHFVALVHSLPPVASDGLMAEHSLDLSPRQTIPGPLAMFPSGPLNQFLRILSSLPKGAIALDDAGKILTPLQQRLADSVGINTDKDDLVQNSPCADVTVVFARGTTEPGNMGLVTGPPFIDALGKQLGNKSLAVQGVEYPATFAGFNKNGTDGVPSMTSFINDVISNCPNTKVVMPGYSQGALVLRSTADTLPATTMSKINSVVTFGDPRNPAPITGASGKSLVICQADDSVCKGGFINVAHLTYGANATMAAQFVIQNANGEWEYSRLQNANIYKSNTLLLV